MRGCLGGAVQSNARCGAPRLFHARLVPPRRAAVAGDTALYHAIPRRDIRDNRSALSANRSCGYRPSVLLKLPARDTWSLPPRRSCKAAGPCPSNQPNNSSAPKSRRRYASPARRRPEESSSRRRLVSIHCYSRHALAEILSCSVNNIASAQRGKHQLKPCSTLFFTPYSTEACQALLTPFCRFSVIIDNIV